MTSGNTCGMSCWKDDDVVVVCQKCSTDMVGTWEWYGMTYSKDDDVDRVMASMWKASGKWHGDDINSRLTNIVMKNEHGEMIHGYDYFKYLKSTIKIIFGLQRCMRYRKGWMALKAWKFVRPWSLPKVTWVKVVNLMDKEGSKSGWPTICEYGHKENLQRKGGMENGLGEDLKATSPSS